VIRVSQLLRSAVVTEGGQKLGHVFDLRVIRRAGSSAERADQQWRIVGLVVGKRGFRQRFGFTPGRGAAAKLQHGLVSWVAVIDTEDGRVTVRDGTRLE
jgi:hypothetical protein